MNEPSQLDRTFQIILKRMIETGQAPHYIELAVELGVTPEEGRKALHELFPPAFLCENGLLEGSSEHRKPNLRV